MSREIELTPCNLQPLGITPNSGLNAGQTEYYDMSYDSSECDTDDPFRYVSDHACEVRTTAGSKKPQAFIEYTVANIKEAKKNGIDLFELFETDELMTFFVGLAAQNRGSIDKMIVIFTAMEQEKGISDEDLQTAINMVIEKHRGEKTVAAMCTYIPNTLKHIRRETEKCMFLEDMNFKYFDEAFGVPGKIYFREAH